MSSEPNFNPKLTRYIPHTPTLQQQAFLYMDWMPEVMFGGAAGGGKSDALLMAALQYVDVPGYAALLLRRSFTDLALPGAIMDRSHEWLSGTDAKWNSTKKTWTFPTYVTDAKGRQVRAQPSTLTFGYLDNDADKYQYQGAEFQFVGFDELTQFLETQYTYLFSRLRRLVGSPVPVRMRAASNPGGIGHEWVYERFINPTTRSTSRAFVPSRIEDNPYVDQVEYRRMLAELDAITRAQLEHGDWDIRPEGGMFKRENLSNLIESIVPLVAIRVRAWDLAATPNGGDYTVGARFALDRNFRDVYIENVVRGRWSPAQRNEVMIATAKLDQMIPGTYTIQLIEQQPGAAGISEMEHLAALMGFTTVEFVKPTGSKYVRAQHYRAACENNRVKLVKGAWTKPFIDEHIVWQGSVDKNEIDDQVDAASMAYNRLYPDGFKLNKLIGAGERIWGKGRPKFRRRINP